MKIVFLIFAALICRAQAATRLNGSTQEEICGAEVIIPDLPQSILEAVAKSGNHQVEWSVTASSQGGRVPREERPSYLHLNRFSHVQRIPFSHNIVAAIDHTWVALWGPDGKKKGVWAKPAGEALQVIGIDTGPDSELFVTRIDPVNRHWYLSMLGTGAFQLRTHYSFRGNKPSVARAYAPCGQSATLWVYFDETHELAAYHLLGRHERVATFDLTQPPFSIPRKTEPIKMKVGFVASPDHYGISLLLKGGDTKTFWIDESRNPTVAPDHKEAEELVSYSIGM